LQWYEMLLRFGGIPGHARGIKYGKEQRESRTILDPTVTTDRPAGDDAGDKTAGGKTAGDKTLRNAAGGRPGNGIRPGTNVSAHFSEAMRAGSVKSAFKLYKRGSDIAIEATVSYDAATKKAVLDPEANLKGGATYRAVVGVGARDLAGKALDQNQSVTGNQQKVWFFTIRSGGGPRG